MGFIKSLCSCPILPSAETGPREETIGRAGKGLGVPQSEGFPTAWISSSGQAGVNKLVWFWRCNLWKHGVIRQDKDSASASPPPVTDAIKSFIVAFLLDKRFYQDHLFIKKIVPIMASLRPPLISPLVFHTVFKLISIWKIKYIHLVILGHLMI